MTRLVLPAAALLALLAPSPGAQSIQVKIDVQAAFLRTWAFDASTDTVPLPLSLLGPVQGKTLRIDTSGDWDNGPGGDEFDLLHAVFSASATLLPKTQQFRVPDALDAGKDTFTSLTAFGNEPTDIPEDFLVAAAPSLQQVAVRVPDGATHLFLAAPDVYYEDNSDPDADYFARVTVIGTWIDLGQALAGAAGLPVLAGQGEMLGGDPWSLVLEDAAPDAPAWLVAGFSALQAPFRGGVLVPAVDLLVGPLSTGPEGGFELSTTWPAGLPSGTTLWLQAWIQDPAGPKGWAASNGLSASTP